MSGIEIVGLILGVFGIAGPLRSIAGPIISTTKTSKSFQDFIDITSSRVLVYENQYLELCKKLLKPMGLDGDEVEAMFSQGGDRHEKWKDEVFIDDLDKHLLSDKNKIYLSMKSVQIEISRLQRKVAKLSKDLFIPSQNYSSHSSGKLSAKDKYKLSRKDKDKFEKNLNGFKGRLEEFEKVVNDFLDKNMEDFAYERRQVRRDLEERLWKRVSDNQWEKVSRRISLSQVSSERLFNTLLESYKCSCHELKLWLDFDLIEALERFNEQLNPLSYYHFFVTLTQRQYADGSGLVRMEIDSLETGQYFQRHQTIEIASGPILLPRLSKSLKPPARGAPAPTGTPSCLTQPTIQLQLSSPTSASIPRFPLPVMEAPQALSPTISKVKKTVRFACEVTEHIKLKRANPSSNQQQASTAPPASRNPDQQARVSPSPDTSDPEDEVSNASEPPSVENLCSLLTRLGSLQSATKNSLGCLKDPQGFRHQLFGCQQAIEKRPSAALRHLLPQIHDFLPDDRLRAAYHLASSLLQLHLPTWAAEGWTSSDLMLAHKESDINKENWLLFSQCFQNVHRGTAGGREGGAGGGGQMSMQPSLRYIHRLGVILLEIGQAEPLAEGLDPNGSNDGDMEDARAKVKGVMGAPYWPVVDICLNWSSRTGMSEDLSDESVQRRFYDEVVQKLKTWVELFGSG